MLIRVNERSRECATRTMFVNRFHLASVIFLNIYFCPRCFYLIMDVTTVNYLYRKKKQQMCVKTSCKIKSVVMPIIKLIFLSKSDSKQYIRVNLDSYQYPATLPRLPSNPHVFKKKKKKHTRPLSVTHT